MELPSLKNFYHFSYSQDAKYQGYFTTNSSANDGRAISAIDLARHMVHYVTIPMQIAFLSIVTAIALIVLCFFGTFAIIAYVNNHSEKELLKGIAINTLKVTGLTIGAIGFLLTKIIIKIVFIAGDLLGVICPEIGRQSRKLEKKCYEKIVNLFSNIGLENKYKKMFGIDSYTREDALKVLDLHDKATQQEIRNKYLALIKQHHPDKIQDPAKKDKANEITREIKKAYEFLKKENQQILNQTTSEQSDPASSVVD